MLSLFCLDSHPTSSCPPGVDALLTPSGLQHSMPAYFPMWISSSPCSNSDTLCRHPSIWSGSNTTHQAALLCRQPPHPTQTQIPYTGYHPTRMPFSPQCLVPQAGPSIHFIPLRFQRPVSDHQTSSWLAPTSHAGQSPHMWIPSFVGHHWTPTLGYWGF